MKKLKDLKGAKMLSRKEQQLVKGGGAGGACQSDDDCQSGHDCWMGHCFLSPKEFPDE